MSTNEPGGTDGGLTDERSERPPLAMEVLPFLERQIITRRFRPGEKLVELDLCARYGISRSPMREALRMLEASGLNRAGFAGGSNS